jgi:hypothetical protein
VLSRAPRAQRAPLLLRGDTAPRRPLDPPRHAPRCSRSGSLTQARERNAERTETLLNRLARTRPLPLGHEAMPVLCETSASPPRLPAIVHWRRLAPSIAPDDDATEPPTSPRRDVRQRPLLALQSRRTLRRKSGLHDVSVGQSHAQSARRHSHSAQRSTRRDNADAMHSDDGR